MIAGRHVVMAIMRGLLCEGCGSSLLEQVAGARLPSLMPDLNESA